jgi:LacI family transcriptional regulator
MATLTDVAKQAGVSPSLVSRVLNNKMVMPVAETTIARITQAAEELGYRPNPLARALITGKTRTIGLFYSDMTDLHFARMLEAVVRRARTLDYKIIVSDELPNLLGKGHTDGVVIIGFPGDEDFTNILHSKEKVAFVYHMQHPMPNTIVWNDFEAGYMVGRYLLGLGHRQVAVIIGTSAQALWAHDKVQGFVTAIQDGGGNYHLSEQSYHDDPIQRGYLATQALLSAHPEVTAFFALHDFAAVGTMQAALALGRNVPQDVSVVGYGDTVLASAAYPQLTSVHTPIAEAGETALEKLIETLENEETTFPGRILPATLTERASCAPARGA